MTVAYGVLFPIGIGIARNLKAMDSVTWFYVHIAVQLTGYCLGLAGWIIGLYVAGGDHQFGLHLYVWSDCIHSTVYHPLSRTLVTLSTQGPGHRRAGALHAPAVGGAAPQANLWAASRLEPAALVGRAHRAGPGNLEHIPWSDIGLPSAHGQQPQW